MAIKIHERFTDKVLYVAKSAKDVREAVEAAVSEDANLGGANLRGANLRDANLRDANLGDANLRGANLRGAYLRDAYLRDANLGDANLRGANLRGAYLGDANLRGANLGDANLRGANLRGANLRGANLRGANLRGANLRGANLRDANLRDANLGDANLRGANLGDANLRGANGLAAERVNDLLMLHDQVGKIRAYKLVNQRGEGPFNGGITYTVGETYEVEKANCDTQAACGAGINLATLPWCLSNWAPGYRVLVCEFRAKDIAAIPISDGKFRVHRCKVVREYELDPVALGLVRDETEEPA